MKHNQLLAIFLCGLVISLPAMTGSHPHFSTVHSFPINSLLSQLVPVFTFSDTISLQKAQTNPTPTYKVCHICGEEESKEAVVQAILFWMATCGHCHYILTEVLPPLEEKYDGQLQILKIEVSTMEDFDRLYQVAQLYNIPKEQVGVPFLVIGDQVLIGSRQIPDELPGLIKMYLSQGGLNFPDQLRPLLPEIAQAEKKGSTGVMQITPTIPAVPIPGLFTVPNNATPLSEQSPTPLTTQTTAMEKNILGSSDTPKQQGFELAFTLEIGMILAFLWSIWNGIRALFWGRDNLRTPGWFCVIWLGIGFIAAAYLAFVEIYKVEAVCGPLSDCNTVQQSDYARLFGMIPMGVLGVGAYLVMFLAWGAARRGFPSWRYWAKQALFVLALFGTSFSIYLTYLELFVIRAICSWCLTSALMMTFVLLSCTPMISKGLLIQAQKKVGED